MKSVYRTTSAILILILLVTAFTPCTVINAYNSADISLSAELSDNGQYINFTLDMREGFSESLYEAYGSDELSLFSLLPYESIDDFSYLLPLTSEIKNVNRQIIRLNIDDDSLYRSYFIAVKKIELIAPIPEETTPDTEDITHIDEVDETQSSDAETGEPPVFEEKISYVPLTSPIYVTSQENASINRTPYPLFTSKKGLDIQLNTDAQRLGISHTVINIALNEYLSTDTKNDCYVKINDELIYFDKNAVSLLDHKVKVYSDAGINVIFNFVLTPPGTSLNSHISEMYYKDRNDDANYFAINVSNKTGYTLARACAEFFTTRYTLGSKKGFVGSYIIGYEINSNALTNSMGPMPLSEYIFEYSKLLRIFTTAAISSYSNSKIYISLGNSFASPSASSPDPTLDYSSRDILQILNEKISADGDIPWRLCVNPYSSDTGKSSFWTDNNAIDTVDSPSVSMKNIGMLSKFLNQPLYYYSGKPRSILIGEIGYSSEGGASYDQSQQAAAFSYAYLKAETDPFIDAMIYHRQIDSDRENGKFGLYSVSASNTLEQKLIYNVFKDIDTDKSAEVTAFALDLIGADSWGELITGYNESLLTKHSVICESSVPYSSLPKRKTVTSIVDISQNAFYPSDNTYSIEDLDNSVKVVTYDTRSSEYRGISHTFESPVSNIDYLKIKLTAYGTDFHGASEVMVRITGKDKDGKRLVYEGVAQVNNELESELYFPVTEYFETSKAESIKIWCRPFTDSQVNDYCFMISEISSVTNGRNGGIIIISIVLALVFLAIVAVVLFYLFFKTSFLHDKKISTTMPHKKHKLRNSGDDPLE